MLTGSDDGLESSILSGIFSIVLICISYNISYGYHELGYDTIGVLKINDPNLRIQEVASGLRLSTHMAFLAPNDILVLEKNNGTVKRVLNGHLLPNPLLDVNVANDGEKGLLGIAIAKNTHHAYVFLYFTKTDLSDGGKILGNMVYRYEFRDNKLIHPKLLLRLPAGPGPYHFGGGLAIGPDGFVYISIGDLYGSCEGGVNNTCSSTQTQSQNYVTGVKPDGRAGIIRVNQDGKVDGAYGILGKNGIVKNYYAYGIRNSFSIDFDPITGNLWDTENGPEYGDEINLIKPGFNSGWAAVQGIWKPKGAERGELSLNPQGLEGFYGKGKYSRPQFIWNHTVGPSAIKFLGSDNYGKNYKNDLFVADSNNGRIYHFNLNSTRTGLLLKDALTDKVADNDRELKNVIFAQGFGIITDLKIAPDGYLYVLTYGSGKIFKIIPAD